MKNKVLAIFKYPRPWNMDVLNRFSNYYETEHLYINEYKNKNFIQIIENMNNLIKSKNIEIVVFDVDYFKFINFFFIERINAKKKILVTGDDFDQHDMHAITASACDMVLSHCPLSVLKFKEKGYEAYRLSFEISNLQTNVEKKDIDVLFFGHITPDRKTFLDHLINDGISLKNVGHHGSGTELSKEDLIKLISKSKIVLNLSKSRTSSVQNYSSESIYKYYYQFKGRIILSGLIGTACISEYSPGQELVFEKDEFITFFTKEECSKILKDLLNNSNQLEEYRKKFTSKVNNLWEDKKNFEPIYESINQKNHRKVKLIKFPYWYKRIAAKQIILRNIKLSSLFSTITQFSVIFSIVKNSSILIKFLILFESLINVFWYTLVSIFKTKK